MKSPYHFFLKNAGYSYGKDETKQQDRISGARALAKVEREATRGGFTYAWSIDQFTTSADWIDDNKEGGRNCDPWQTWQCVMLNSDGRIVNSLHGIDFGRDRSPWGDSYRRVVEAELALEGITNKPQGFYDKQS